MTALECVQIGGTIYCQCGNPSSHYGTMGERGARVVKCEPPPAPVTSKTVTKESIDLLLDDLNGFNISDGYHVELAHHAVRRWLAGLTAETSGDWQPIETFDFVQGFAATRWVLVHTSDGRVTEGLPFIFDGDKRGWICACGNNAHDPRYIPSPSLLRDTVTHWMPKPAPPQVKTSASPDDPHSDLPVELNP